MGVPAEQFGADSDLTEVQQECVRDAVDDGMLQRVMSLSFQGQEEAAQEGLAPAFECLFGEFSDG